MALMKHSLKHILKDLTKRNDHPHGNLLTLSRYHIGLTPQFVNEAYTEFKMPQIFTPQRCQELSLSDAELFGAMGFDEIDSMDYSDYECAKLIHDLNDANVPDKCLCKYDFILDAGTLEHIGNLMSALECVFKMLKIGGVFYFDQPVFGGVNHGFYNISPCFYYEYFLENNYNINDIRLFEVEKGIARDMELSEAIMRGGSIPINTENNYTIWGSVTKTVNTVCNKPPYQKSYSDLWQNPDGKRSAVGDIFDQTSGSVFLYGAGLETVNILNSLTKNQREQLETSGGILSSMPEEIGHTLFGVRITDISKVKPTDTIIIASSTHRDEIYERIKDLANSGVKII